MSDWHNPLRDKRGQRRVPLSNDSIWSYKDWKLGLSYALPKDFTIGAFASGTSGASNLGYGAVTEFTQVPGLMGPFPRNIGKTTGTVFLKKTF